MATTNTSIKTIGEGWVYISEADAFVLNNGQFVIMGEAVRGKLVEDIGPITNEKILIILKKMSQK